LKTKIKHHIELRNTMLLKVTSAAPHFLVSPLCYFPETSQSLALGSKLKCVPKGFHSSCEISH